MLIEKSRNRNAERANKLSSGWVDGWMGGWVGGWMDGWVGGLGVMCVLH